MHIEKKTKLSFGEINNITLLDPIQTAIKHFIFAVRQNSVESL